MFILFILFLFVGFPANSGEACFTGEPKLVTFDNGHTVKILGRTGDDLTYSVILPDGRWTESVSRLAMFPLHTRPLPGPMFTYDYTKPLPERKDLTVGTHFAVHAVQHLEGMPDTDVQIDGDVLRDEVIRIGVCDYPTRVFSVTNYRDGKVVGKAVVHLNMDMLVSLQTNATAISGLKAFDARVIKLE